MNYSALFLISALWFQGVFSATDSIVTVSTATVPTVAENLTINVDQKLMMPYFDSVTKRFHNSENENISHLIDSAKIGLRQKLSFANFFHENFQVNDWVKIEKPVEKSKNPVITWLGHSTFLIQLEDINIITDPVFFDLCWHGFKAYPRKMPLGIPLAQIPKIDFIIISHTHMDHVDEPSLKYVLDKNPDVALLSPMGSKNFFNKLGFENVREFTWWEYFEYNDIKFYFLPAIHWSNRSLFDINKILWGSWMIQTDSNCIYFAGDSAYNEHYKQIASKFKKIDIALMPIGPIEPREIVKAAHMSAQEAVKAFIDLNASIFVPMHWGTFGLGTDLFDTALISLEKAEKDYAKELSNQKINTLKFGESITL